MRRGTFISQKTSAEGPLAGDEGDAVEPCAVGAAEVAQSPTAIGKADLGVIAADRIVVEHHFHGTEPADAQQIEGLPRLPLERAVQSAKANGPFHSVPPAPEG